MSARFLIALVALTSALCAAADDAFTFCSDDNCGDCPVAVTSIGTGFPNCAIYNSSDVFGNQNFNSSGSLTTAYIDVPIQQQESPCYIIFKSPAQLDMPGCGVTQWYFKDEGCGAVELKETFMVQFCCGKGDCAAAGIPGESDIIGNAPLLQSAKFGHGTGAKNIAFSSDATGAGGGVQSLRIAVNGTEIEPIYVGPPQVTTEISDTASVISQRSVCKKDWTPKPGYEDYRRPADGTQLVSGLVQGPLSTEIQKTRSQEWTQSLDMDLGFDDILSLGIGFSSSFSESISDSETLSYDVPAGVTGYIGWTSFLRCTQGSGTCHKKTVSGEICTPYNDANLGKLAGSS
ncbi:hypothetical protein F5Y03DRAFT_403781 [Xylaria venustula]|nr:hypothetical protein F5Y03DRAFT_403781 [Xylaria venustula]